MKPYGAAAADGKSDGGDASLDVEQLALALTLDPQDQEPFPELHNVRPCLFCLFDVCLSVSVLQTFPHLSGHLSVYVTAWLRDLG